MILTIAILALFRGGEVAVENLHDKTLYRSNIEAIKLQRVSMDDEIEIIRDWTLEALNSPPSVTWKPIYVVKKFTITIIDPKYVEDIGPAKFGEDSMIRISSPLTHEVITLYPRNGSRVNPASVTKIPA